MNGFLNSLYFIIGTGEHGEYRVSSKENTFQNMKQNSDLSVLNLLCIFESVDTLYAYEVWPYVVEVILIS